MEVNSLKSKNSYHNYVAIKQSDNSSPIELILCGADGAIESNLNTTCTVTLLDVSDNEVRHKSYENIVGGILSFYVTNDLKSHTHNLEITLSDGKKYPADGKFDVYVSPTHDKVQLNIIEKFTLDEAYNLLANNLVGERVDDRFKELSIDAQQMGEVIIARGDSPSLDDELSRIEIKAETEVADIKKGFRWSPGGTGSESTINIFLGYIGNKILNGVRGATVLQGSKNSENVVGGLTDNVGKDAENLLDPSIPEDKKPHYAIAGGYDTVVNALAAIAYSYHSIIDFLATHGAIFGGSFHRIKAGDYAGIFAGSYNVIKYTLGGAYSIIMGGKSNNLFARFSLISASLQGRIGDEVNQKEYSSIIASLNSTIDGNNASVTNGIECKATRDFSHASGKYAVANNIGERVFSTGRFKTTGDSGQSILHLMRQSTTGVETQLLPDDTGSNILTPVGANTTLTLSGTVTGHRVDAEGSANFKFTATLYRGSGNLTVTSLNIEKIYASDSLYNMNVKALSNNAFQVVAKGVEGHIINWTCRLNMEFSRNI